MATLSGWRNFSKKWFSSFPWNPFVKDDWEKSHGLLSRSLSIKSEGKMQALTNAEFGMENAE
jgi:hypothetical protein